MAGWASRSGWGSEGASSTRYVDYDNFVTFTGSGDDDSELWSVTGTSDFALTENLTWKIEVKYETADDANRQLRYRDGSNDSDEDYAVYLGTQLYYEF